LEDELQWTGICVEPNPLVFSTLKMIRKCLCINGCVANMLGEHPCLAVNGAASMLSELMEFIDETHQPDQ
jgi:hypothetical protein